MLRDNLIRYVIRSNAIVNLPKYRQDCQQRNDRHHEGLGRVHGPEREAGDHAPEQRQHQQFPADEVFDARIDLVSRCQDLANLIRHQLEVPKQSSLNL